MTRATDTARPAGCRIGTAGWSIPRQASASFPEVGSHLARYGAVFTAAEIDTSFYRPHRQATYARWAASVPEDFRFGVKLPRSISHERRLIDAYAPLARFMDEVGGLGAKLGVLILQLPPSLLFDAEAAATFLALLRAGFQGHLVCEARHASWFEAETDPIFEQFAIGRVDADPPIGRWRATASAPIVYRRLHGAPKMYRSPYDDSALRSIAGAMARDRAEGRESWTILDNTASGAATGNALTLQAALRERRSDR